MRIIILQILVIFLFQPGKTQNWNWAKGFGGSGFETIPSMKVNDQEEVLIAGSFNETVNFGSTSLESIQGSDAFLAKLDQQGSPLWAIRAGSFNNDFSIDTEVDAQGNILWLGQYWVMAVFENDTIYSGSNVKAYFIAKYNSDGQLLWVKSINGSATKVVNDLSINTENDLFLTGYFNDSLIVENILLTSQAEEDAFVLKISGQGVPLWGVQYGDSGIIRPQRIENTSTGQLVIAGDITGSVTFGADDLISVSTDFDNFIALLDENGLAVWGRMGTGVFDNLITALAVNANDQIYISGYFTGVLKIEGEEIVTPGFIENLYLLKLNAAGELLWIRGLDDTEFNDPSFSYDLALKNDLVLMTGQFRGALLIDDLELTEEVDFQGFIASFDGIDGKVKKLSKINGTAPTSGSQVFVDAGGQLYIAGTHFEQVSFGSHVLVSAGGTDLFIAQANPTFTGTQDWFLDNEKIGVFPNPVYETLYLNALAPTFQVEIFDSYGRLVSITKNKNQLNVQYLISGNYFLRYQSKEAVWMVPFVKL